jgi:hypothetical protein
MSKHATLAALFALAVSPAAMAQTAKEKPSSTPVTIVGQTDPLSVSGIVMVAPSTLPLASLFSKGASASASNGATAVVTAYANVLPNSTGYALTNVTARVVARGDNGCRGRVEVIESSSSVFNPGSTIATLYEFDEPKDSSLVVPLTFPGVRIAATQTVRLAVTPGVTSQCTVTLNVQGLITP